MGRAYSFLLCSSYLNTVLSLGSRCFGFNLVSFVLHHPEFTSRWTPGNSTVFLKIILLQNQKMFDVNVPMPLITGPVMSRLIFLGACHLGVRSLYLVQAFHGSELNSDTPLSMGGAFCLTDLLKVLRIKPFLGMCLSGGVLN